MFGRISASIMAVLSLASATPAWADDAKGTNDKPYPVSLSLFAPVQIAPVKRSVTGFRLNIYGHNQDVIGLDIGIVNRASGDFGGFQWLGFGWVEGDVSGAQWNYIANVGKGDLRGLQFGFFNYVGKDTMGAQLGAVDWSQGKVTGLQLSAVNYSKSVHGLQLGLVNVTDNLRGMQIGLVNVARNGFLPVFPIFNFHFE